MEAKKMICAAAGMVLLVGSVSEGRAQHAYFPVKGRITFEKEVYVRARAREMQNRTGGSPMDGRWSGGNRPLEDMPEKSTSMFVLQFDEDETLMQPLEAEEAAGSGSRPKALSIRGSRGSRSGGSKPSSGQKSTGGQKPPGGFGGRQQPKTYYQNLKTGLTEIELELDDKYLLKDSLQVVTWRFTDEYRDIAGYECRRVNGATADSLYIVAFYTDQIPVSGGPVLTGGLPGMILGLAIPEMHINYWARQVDLTVDNVPRQWRDKKSKALRMDDFFQSLTSNRAFGIRDQSETQQRRNVLERLIY